jgi:YHS domain-containing protein
MKTALLFLTATLLLAAEKPVDPVNKSNGGVAVRGTDVVAYFEQSAVVKGTREFTHDWNGAIWLFATAAHRDTFKANPAKYAPQFGGYCAWAVGHGYTANADPEAWKIIDGKLYLNYNKSIQRKWDPESAKWIAEGNKNWPGLHK